MGWRGTHARDAWRRRCRSPGPVLVLAGGVLAAGGCAARHGPSPSAPQPVPWADTLPIREPAEVDPSEMQILVSELIVGEASRLSVREAVSGAEEALNVTAFDEVVPSAWYEHRITGAGVTPEEVRRGPPGRPPSASGPLTVVDAKVEGVTPGFTVEDQKGDRYLLKFDPPGYPGLASGADAVVSRLFWAAGYHVPHDVVIDLDPGRLVVGEDAEFEAAGVERVLTAEDIASALEGAARRPDGTIPALASLFVPGVPKGPFRFQGTRDDDPNDYYPHEHRRELRGVWILSAWLNNVDLRFANTLDSWIEPTGYLRHYMIDFGTTLGSGALRPLSPRWGREYAFDFWAFWARAVTLGLYRVGWEGSPGTLIHPSLGWMSIEDFDAGEWKPFTSNDAFRNVTARDGYWGAKRVAALDSEHVRAAVAAGRYPPVATDTLVDILLHRRRKVLRHWYAKVTPAEELEARWSPEPDGSAAAIEISFRDGGVTEELWTADETAYRWSGRQGTVDVVEGTTAPGGTPGACPRYDPSTGHATVTVALSSETPGRDDGGSAGPAAGWIELELTAERPGADGRAALVRIEWREGGPPRVTGVTY